MNPNVLFMLGLLMTVPGMIIDVPPAMQAGGCVLLAMHLAIIFK